MSLRSLDLPPIQEDSAASKKAWDTRGRGKKEKPKKPRTSHLDQANLDFYNSIAYRLDKERLSLDHSSEFMRETHKLNIESYEAKLNSVIDGTWNIVGETMFFYSENTHPDVIDEVTKQIQNLPDNVTPLESITVRDDHSKTTPGVLGFFHDGSLTLNNTGSSSDQDSYWELDSYGRRGVISHEVAHHIYRQLPSDARMEWHDRISDVKMIAGDKGLQGLSYYLEDLVDDQADFNTTLVEESFTEMRRIQQHDQKKWNQLKSSPIWEETAALFESICKENGQC